MKKSTSHMASRGGSRHTASQEDDDNELASLLPKEFLLEQQKKEAERIRREALRAAGMDRESSWSYSCCALTILVMTIITLLAMSDDPGSLTLREAKTKLVVLGTKAVMFGASGLGKQTGISKAEQPDPQIKTKNLLEPAPDAPPSPLPQQFASKEVKKASSPEDEELLRVVNEYSDSKQGKSTSDKLVTDTTEALNLLLQKVGEMKEEIDGLKQNASSQAPILSAKPTGPTILSRMPSEDDLLLDEIPLSDPANLADPSIEQLAPYTLYRTPSDAWVTKAQAIIDENKDKLKTARDHVDDPEQRVTIVTALLDLGRGNLADVGQFKRSFDTYIQRFQRTVNVNFPMIVFMDAHHVSMLDLETHTRGIIIIPWSVNHMTEAYRSYYDRIEEIRHSKLYLKQAQYTGWLQYSPQAALNHYNLLVMTKPFLLRWASELNPFRTQYLMFVDAGHDCIGALKPDHLDLMRHLMGRMMVTFFDYSMGLVGETHGMTQQAYRTYLGPPHNDPKTWASDSNCCRVVRGGIFGGTPAYIDVVARVYNEALSQSLSDGYMGTEENVLGMCLARFPDLFNPYQNVRDNCDVFVDAGEKSPADGSIYIQGDEPDVWSPEKKAFVSQKGKRERYVSYAHRIRG